MAKETNKSSAARPAGKRSPRRGSRVRSDARNPLYRLFALCQSRAVAWGLLITVLFGMLTGMVASWARDQPLLSAGRVARYTHTVRVPFSILDRQSTERDRAQARQTANLVFQADEAVLGELRASIEGLPRTLATAESLEQVDEGIRQRFGLSAEGLAAVRGQAGEDGEPSQWYRSRVDAFWQILLTRPILDQQTWQQTSDGQAEKLRLVRGDGDPLLVDRFRAINAESGEPFRLELNGLLANAGFDGALREVLLNRLTIGARPTYRLDTAATVAAQDTAAESVPEVVRDFGVGAKVFTRGNVLTAGDIDVWRAELSHFKTDAARWRVWVRKLSVVGASLAIAIGAALYAAMFCPRVRRKVSRMAWIASLLAGALLVACVGSVAEPWALTITAVAPTVFVAAILVIAYDQRLALAFSALHAALVCMALDQPIGMFGLIMTGAGVAVLQLRDLRSRESLIRMGVVTGAALAAGTLLVATIDRPVVEAAIWQTLRDAFWAGVGGLGVAALVLFVLPLIERAFDITTGMTLIELRDPKSPLLRELQQRAPGTYNHSLNVATIAEAAASAIHADTLLTYAGALYHDIGKMNKPEYFVENQTGGISKHEKLSPAMSLLVIVGHVKDGLEMGREYGLPKSLQHFIEAHHGTTLVEYFYHRAKKKAEESEDGAEEPTELEYRYPGPKPRTREVAILMIADAVESATRTLSEPTPARIDQLVRSIANKRLLDGQFEHCDLTLSDLKAIVDSVSKSVASSYHGRVVYPAGGESKQSDSAPAAISG